MSKKEKIKAFAYLRTSSAANVGADNKDSDKRQREAIEAFAKRAGYVIVEEFNDAAVSGTDPIESRPGFSALLDAVEANGTRTVIVEDASRFSRDLITQELGILTLISRSVRVVTCSGDDLTETTEPFKVAMRQIAGAFAQLEKARLVHKLKVARDRKRATGIKVEGRKNLAETHPAAVALARELARKRKQKLSLRAISAELAAAGHINERGKPFAAKSIASMLR
jgi:DNA invertase Pin-like site-specific DNA recombinase